MNKAITIAGLISILASCSSTPPPSIQHGPDAEVTYDGLHRVDNSKSQVVYIKPDIDLSRYDKLLLEGLGIQYRPVDPQNRYDRNAEEFPLTESQKENIRIAVTEAILEELGKSRYFTIVDKPGRDVLRIRLGLSDVVSRVPPRNHSSESFYLTNLGGALLVMEYSDSRTNEVLARVADRQEIEPAVMTESNAVTNRSEVKRLIRTWGVRIRDGLDELHSLGCLSCTVTNN